MRTMPASATRMSSSAKLRHHPRHHSLHLGFVGDIDRHAMVRRPVFDPISRATISACSAFRSATDHIARLPGPAEAECSAQPLCAARDQCHAIL